MDGFKKHRLVIVVFVIAMGLRIGDLILLRDNPFFKDPIMDEKYHVEWAEDIASGEVFANVPFYRAPAYPYVLGAIYSIFGKGYFIPRLFGLLLGSLSCVLVFLIGQAVFSRKVGLLAGMVMAIHPMHLYFDYMLLTVGLEIFTSLLSIWLFLLWFRNRTNLYLFLSGLSLGLAIISRPNFLVFVPVMLLVLLLDQSISFGQRLRHAVTYCVGLLPLILLVACVNIIIGKDFVLLAYNGGINFYFGNNPYSTGWTASSPEIHPSWWSGYRDAVILAQRDLGTILRPSQVSNYWFGRGFKYILSEPLSWLGLIVKKAYLFFNSFELSNNQSIYGFNQFSFLLRNPVLNFGVIFALSVIGAIAGFTKKHVKLLLVLVIVYSFSIIIFLVTARYRMPVIPLMILLASFAVFWIIDHVKSKTVKPVILALIICIGMFIFSQTDLYGTHVVNNELIHVSLGNRYFAQQQFHKAIQEYRAAIKDSPNMWEAMNALGNAYMAQRDYDRAMEMYDRSLAIHENIDALCKKGFIYSLKGERKIGEYNLLKAFTLDPEHPEVFYYAGLHYIYYQESRKALISFKKALDYYPDPEYMQSLNYNIGKLHLQFGETDSAYKYLTHVNAPYLDTDSLLHQLHKFLP